MRLTHEAAGAETLVAGNLCLTWKYAEGGTAATEQCRQLFEYQIAYQMEGGEVDFFIGETFLHVGEALVALEMHPEDRPDDQTGFRDPLTLNAG